MLAQQAFHQRITVDPAQHLLASGGQFVETASCILVVIPCPAVQQTKKAREAAHL